jgi:hypothetical protein
MKLSELKKQIKDNIYEILSEETVDELTMVGPKTDSSDVADIVRTEKTDTNTVKAAIAKAKSTNSPVNVAESEDEDREPTKAELEKEKVKGAPSKFKVSNDQFEDFKDKLKTLVKKVKEMEKGEAKDKKMAALKQFIKKPELVKAFKERDVKIDTGGLVD